MLVTGNHSDISVLAHRVECHLIGFVVPVVDGLIEQSVSFRFGTLAGFVGDPQMVIAEDSSYGCRVFIATVRVKMDDSGLYESHRLSLMAETPQGWELIKLHDRYQHVPQGVWEDED